MGMSTKDWGRGIGRMLQAQGAECIKDRRVEGIQSFGAKQEHLIILTNDYKGRMMHTRALEA